MANITPSSPSLGDVFATKRATIELTVTVEATGGAADPVTPTLSDDGGGLFSIESAPSIAPGSSATVVVAFQSSSVPSPATVTATLEVGDTTATITATVKSPITIGADSLDFGDVVVGAEHTKFVLVTNSHDTDEATLSSDDGSFAALPDTVPNTGVPQAVWIKFTPAAVDATSRSATLTATAGALADTCALRGKGVAAEEPSDLSAVDYDANVGSDGSGNARQRFHIDIPNPHTYLGLGAQLTGYSDSFTTHGIGLETTKDIYINGIGEDGGSHLFAQATGNVVIQSTSKSIYSTAAEKNVIDSGGVSYMMGSGGVLIASGLPLSHSSLDPVDGERSTTAADIWGIGFTATDMLVGTILTSLGIKSEVDDWKDSGKFKRAHETIGNSVALGGVLLGGLGAAGVVPTTTILGAAGVTVATFGYTAIYGLAGLGLVSTFPTLLGLVDANVIGVDDATLSALTGNANVQGSKVAIKANEKIEIEASSGKKAGTALYSPISVDASQVAITAHDTAASLQPGGLGAVNVEAALKTVIGVGKFLVKVTPEMVRIGMRTAEGEVMFDNGKPSLTLDGESVLLQLPADPAGTKKTVIDLQKASLELVEGSKPAAAAGSLKLANGNATLASGSASNVEVSAAGIKLKSAGVDLTADGNLSVKGGVIKLG